VTQTGQRSGAGCSALHPGAATTLRGAIPHRRGCRKPPAFQRSTAALTDLHLVAQGDLDLCNHLVKMSTTYKHLLDTP